MVSLGQPDLIKHSETVYMHQITPHALCRELSGVALQSPSRLLFGLHLSSFPFLEHTVFPACRIFFARDLRMDIIILLVGVGH